MVPLLNPLLHLVALDLPGHGLSAHLPPGDLKEPSSNIFSSSAGLHYHDMEHLAAIKAVVTQMAWTRFSIIGHSMGVTHLSWNYLKQVYFLQAGLAALYAAAFPEEIESLVMIDMAGMPPRFPKKTLIMTWMPPRSRKTPLITRLSWLSFKKIHLSPTYHGWVLKNPLIMAGMPPRSKIIHLSPTYHGLDASKV